MGTIGGCEGEYVEGEAEGYGFRRGVGEVSQDSQPEEVEAPSRPDLRCREHESVCDVVHGMLGRLLLLEERVKMLEDK